MVRWPILSRQLTVILARLLFWHTCRDCQICNFEHTTSIKKRLYTASDCVYSDYFVFCFLNGMLADLVKAIDCFGRALLNTETERNEPE